MTQSSPVPTPRRRVLVALPPQSPPHDVIEAGRVVARALTAALHGVLVWPTAISPTEVPRLLRVDPADLAGMVIDVAVGDPAERLRVLTSAHPVAFLLIVADENGRDLCGLGDVASRTLAATSAGVIILRPSTKLVTVKRILAPLDGTPSTAAALAPAGELAQRLGAGLDLVLIEDLAAPPSTESGAMAPPQYVDQPQHEWPAFSAEFLQRFLGSIAHVPRGVPTRFFLGAGHPADEILRFARELDTDLIALVWHGGCAAEPGLCFRDVVRGTRRPVLVLRR